MVICEPILRAIVDGLESQQHTIESFESEASPALSSVFGIRPAGDRSRYDSPPFVTNRNGPS